MFVRSTRVIALAAWIGIVPVARAQSKSDGETAPPVAASAPSSSPASPAPPPRAMPSAPLAPAPGLPPDAVTIKVVSDDPRAGLFAKDAHPVGIGDEVVESWSFVCLAPCGERVDSHRAYRIMGEGIVPSVQFNLAPGSGSVALRVEAHHTAAPAVTTTLAVLGGTGALGGILLLLIDAAEHGIAGGLDVSKRAKTKVENEGDTYGDIGAGMLIGGVVFGGTALIYAVARGKTDVAPAGGTTQTHARSNDIRWIPFGFAF